MLIVLFVQFPVHVGDRNDDPTTSLEDSRDLSQDMGQGLGGNMFDRFDQHSLIEVPVVERQILC